MPSDETNTPSLAPGETAWLRAVVEDAPVGICETDPAGRFLRTNPRFCALTGYAPDELAGVTFDRITHPDDAPGCRDLARRLWAGEVPSFTREKRYLQKDGHPVWVNESCSLARDAAGRPVCEVRVVQDASMRKLAEEALRDGRRRLQREQARLEEVLRQMPAGVLLAEAPAGRVGYANARAEELLGDLLPAAADHLPVARALRGEVIAGEEMPVPRPDGERAWLSVNAAPLRDERGAVTAAVLAVEDVTRRKAAEEELRDASRRKDEFLAMLAHELRNPLAPIRNTLETMKFIGIPAEFRRSHEVMDRQVRHMVRLLDDLLDVSRITRGKLTLHRGRVDLGEVVRQAVEISRPHIEAHGHHLAVDLPPDPVWLDADPARLTQVMANLLNNAAKYTDRGGRISLAVERDGADAVVRVCDTGVGIPPDMLARVFDLFTQVEGPKDRIQDGLGVGLALSKRLVEMHGGTIAARSDGVGRGSEFVVRLPLAPTPAPPTAGPAPPAQPPARRVVVADDNVDSADSLAAFLRLRGHEVRAVYDGPSALRTVADFRPEVVILDIGMPGMTGHEVARRLREREEFGGLRLVALTGWGQEADRQRSREAGFDLHFVKPVDPDVLAGALTPARRQVR